VDVKNFVKLRVDLQWIEIPKGIKSILFMNISSYAGGTNPWGTSKTGWYPQSTSDSIIEVVGLKGPTHMGMIQAGLAKGERISQGTNLFLEIASTRDAIYGQVDGEPFLIKTPVKLEVGWCGKVKMLCNESIKVKV